MKIVQNSPGTNYGNCVFDWLWLSGKTSFPVNTNILQIAGAPTQTTLFNLNSFNGLYISNYASTVTGTHGVDLGEGVKTNTFIMPDIENCDIGVYLQGAGSGAHECAGNTFGHGFINAAKSCIQTGTATSANSFRDIRLSQTTGVIINEGSASPNVANSYENLSYSSSTSTVIVGQGIFRGFAAGALNYFSNQGTNIQSGNGSTTIFNIAHKIVGTPRFYGVLKGAAGLPVIDYLTVNAANIMVHFVSAPPRGTNNVVLVWNAQL
jgi:hypothetical protein